MMRMQIFEADLIFALYSLEAIYKAACTLYVWSWESNEFVILICFSLQALSTPAGMRAALRRSAEHV